MLNEYGTASEWLHAVKSPINVNKNLQEYKTEYKQIKIEAPCDRGCWGAATFRRFNTEGRKTKLPSALIRIRYQICKAGFQQ